MQNNDLKKLLIALVTVIAVLGSSPAFASKSSQLDLAKKELRAVPTAEMPAQAAKMVSAAKSNVAQATAEMVVTAAIELKSATAAAVVGAISAQNSDLAPIVAAKAAELRPKNAAVIARAAAGAAPSQAAKIAYAVCKVVPSQYAQVATAIAQVAPSAKKEILASVVSAIPALRPFVERAAGPDQKDAMGVIMANTEKLLQATAQSANVSTELIMASTTPSSPSPAYTPLPPPTVGPPFTPALGSPTELDHTATEEVPTNGGRNYFGP